MDNYEYLGAVITGVAVAGFLYFIFIHCHMHQKLTKYLLIMISAFIVGLGLFAGIKPGDIFVFYFVAILSTILTIAITITTSVIKVLDEDYVEP